jgi:hypothetical protein
MLSSDVCVDRLRDLLPSGFVTKILYTFYRLHVTPFSPSLTWSYSNTEEQYGIACFGIYCCEYNIYI